MKKTKINLLGRDVGKTQTKIQTPQKRKYRQFFFVLLFAFVILFFEIAFLFTFYQNLTQTAQELATQKDQLTKKFLSLQDEVSNLRDQRPNRSQTKLPKLEMLETFRSKEMLKTLSEISDQIPQNAWMSYVAMKDFKLTLQGFAVHHKDISIFMKSLEKVSLLKNVQLMLAEKSMLNKNIIHKFTIICDLEKT